MDTDMKRKRIALLLAALILAALLPSCGCEIYLPLNRLSADDMNTRTGKAAVLTVNAAIDAMEANGNSGETLVEIMRNSDTAQSACSEIVSGYENDLVSLAGCADLEQIALDEIREFVDSGMTEEEAVRAIQEDVDRLTPTEKGLYMNEGVSNLRFSGGHRWKDGVIPYYFDGISENGKKVIRQAMDDWEQKTGCIRFVEIEYTLGMKICSALGQYECLRIENDDDGGHTNCTVGCGLRNKMLVCETKYNNPNVKVYGDGSAYFLHDMRHELGHCIGLRHEQQRHDRDRYVIVDEKLKTDTVNYGIIPQRTVYFGYKTITLFGLTIYIPYIWYGDFSFTVGEFDFDSIMLYGGLKLTPEYSDPDHGECYVGYENRVTRFDNGISENDVLAVRKMYGKDPSVMVAGFDSPKPATETVALPERPAACSPGFPGSGITSLSRRTPFSFI